MAMICTVLLNRVKIGITLNFSSYKLSYFNVKGYIYEKVSFAMPADDFINSTVEMGLNYG